MGKNIKIVIIIDESASMRELAGHIAAIIRDCPGYTVTVFQAESFSGENLLPAQIFFLGCEKPNPPSFFYIEVLLGHINLAGRPCGIFSCSAKSNKYLSLLVRDSESVTANPFLAKNGTAGTDALRAWIQDILQKKRG